MKCAVFIPVRYGSTRFPGKPLADINGKSMVRRVWENASSAKSIDRVCVLTDNEEIVKECQMFGAEVLMTPGTVRSGTERIASVIGRFGEYDMIFNMQGDEPLFKGADLDSLLNRYPADEKTVCGTYCYPLDPSSAADPNKVKVVANAAGEALYFSRSPIPTGGPFLKHIGVYLFRREFIKTYIGLPAGKLEISENLEQLRILEHGYKICLKRTESDTVAVDTQEDLEKVRMILNEK